MFTACSISKQEYFDVDTASVQENAANFTIFTNDSAWKQNSDQPKIEISSSIDAYFNEKRQEICLDKQYYDSLSMQEQAEINKLLKDSLDEGKRVCFLGNQDNLDYLQIMKDIDKTHTLPFSLQREDRNANKVLIGIALEKYHDNQLVLYRCFTENLGLPIEDALNLLLYDDSVSKPINIEGAVVTDCGYIVDLFNGIDFQAGVYYNLYKGKQNQDSTQWETRLLTWVSPKNNIQTQSVEITHKQKDTGSTLTDEQLISFIPNPASAGQEQHEIFSGAIGCDYTTVYEDIEIETGKYEELGDSILWKYLFVKNTDAAKNKKWLNAGSLWKNYKDNCAIDIQVRYLIEGKEPYDLHTTIEKG